MAQNNNILELDFTGIESSNLIPEGTHTVVVSDAVFSKASTGSDQLQVTFKAADGAVRSAWYNLLPTALWKLKGFLETLGVPCEGKIKLNTKVLLGKTCMITVEKDANDPNRLVITRTAKLDAATGEITYGAPAPQLPVNPAIPQMPEQMAPQQAAAAPQFVPQATVQPQAATVSPVPPVQQAQQPMGNLPPWMQQAPQQAAAAPTNLPPWMKK